MEAVEATEVAQTPAVPDADPFADKEDDYFEDGFAGDAKHPGQQSSNSDEVREIDATLARFSAVHDQIAEEEAERRKKYSWLLGKRKEPELGTDMPFDFVEGRDAQASRIQWKKQERKRRTTWAVAALAIAATLLIVVVIGVSMVT